MKQRHAILTIILFFMATLTSVAFANVSYLGPAGTYTEEATVLFFGEKEAITPVRTVPEALSLVKNGQCQYAVIPVENTIGGPVYNYLDAVVNDPELVIVGEVNLPIRQTLLGLPGTKLNDIKTVMSHPQGLVQSKEWLKTNLPEVKLVEVSSTAEAAKRVAEMGDKTVAAIAASRTAAVYGLEILASDLQYSTTNVTRFWVVTLKKNQSLGSQRTALVLKGSAEALPQVLAAIHNKGFRLVSVHDRPAQTVLGEYVYVIEVTGGDMEALQKIIKKYGRGLDIRVVGVFDTK